MAESPVTADNHGPRVARLEVEVSTLSRDIGAVRADMSGMRAELKEDIDRVGNEVSKSFADLVKKLDATARPNWQAAGVAVAVVGLIVTVLMAGLGYFAWTSSESARAHADRRFEQTAATIEGLAQVIEQDRDAAREFRETMREEWSRVRADYDATDAEILALHERTRFEQGKADSDRHWQAELGRMLNARIDRLESRVVSEEQRP